MKRQKCVSYEKTNVRNNDARTKKNTLHVQNFPQINLQFKS